MAVVALGALGLAACGGGDDGASTSDWCDLARDVDQLDSTFDVEDPADLKDAFSEAEELLDDAADQAPGEIEDDVRTLRDAFSDLVDALEDVDVTDFEVVTEALESIDSEEVEAASDRVQQFTEEECGITSDDTDAPDDTDASSDDTDATDDTATDDTGATEDTDASSDGSDATLPSGDDISDIIDSLRQAFPNLSDDQLDCLVEGLMAQGGNPGDVSDPSVFLELFDSCGIDLAELGGG